MEENIEADVEEKIPSSEGITQDFFAYFRETLSFLQTYGFILLVLAIATYFLWKRYSGQIQNSLSSSTASSASHTASNGVTDEAAMRRLQAMTAARERQQAKLNEDAQKDKEERLKREEEKQRQKAAEWERMQSSLSDTGHTLGNGTESSSASSSSQQSANSASAQKRKPLRQRDDYLPLGGGGGEGRSRPSACGPSRGGGG